MKIIDFIEQLQKFNPSKRIGFCLCYDKEKFASGRTSGTPGKASLDELPSQIFEPFGEEIFTNKKQTQEELFNSPDEPLLVFITPIKGSKNAQEKTQKEES